MKVKKVEETLIGSKHKATERCTIFDPVTEELITDESEILATTLKYNIGVLTKNKVAEQDIPEVEKQNKLHEWLMNDTTYKDVLKHLKKKSYKCGELFQDAMFIYMADFMAQEIVPDTYDDTKLFGLWKGKGNKLDLNMTRYIHGKD